MFDSVKAAELSISRQKRAFFLNAAPPVLSDLIYVAHIGVGYITGNAEKASTLIETDRNNWENNLVIPEFKRLSDKIQTIIPGYKDLHSANVGVWDNLLVCIDFFDNDEQVKVEVVLDEKNDHYLLVETG
jgi:hypothetical protein